MLLGLTRPDRGEVAVFGRTPRRAIAEGLVGAMLQNGGMPDDITAGEVVRLVAALFPRSLPVDETLRRAGIADVARRAVRTAVGGTEAAGAVRRRARLRSGPAGARRADGRDGRRGPPGVLGGDARLHRRSHGALRDPLPRRGRGVRRPRGAAARGGRWSPTAASRRCGRSPRAGRVGHRRGPGRVAGLPGVSGVRVEGSRIHLTCDDSDLALRALLAARPTAADLEVVAHGLEDAFVRITALMSALLASEVRRIFRSPRFLIFTVGLPLVYFLMFSGHLRARRRGGRGRADGDDGRVRGDLGVDERRRQGRHRTRRSAGTGSCASRRCPAGATWR